MTSETHKRRFKRSRAIALTSLMAGAGVSLSACDTTPEIEKGPKVDAFAYSSLEACKMADEVPDTECDSSFAAAKAEQEKSAPRFADAKTCEETYGAGQCVPRSQAGSSFFTPLLTGFVIGRMLDGGYRGGALYRDQRDGGYYTGYGGRLQTDYATGRTQVSARSIDPPDSIKSAPPRVQTRTSVVSRGGFGGGGRSYGG